MKVYGYYAIGKHFIKEKYYYRPLCQERCAVAEPIPYMAEYPQPPRVYHKDFHLCVEVRN